MANYDGKKELRIVISAEALERLERQASLLDVPPSTWARAIIMEKVTAFESATSNAQALAMMGDFYKQMSFEFSNLKTEESRKK